MPELPEVESVVKRLRRDLCGKTINEVKVCWKRSIFTPESKLFRSGVKGRKVKAISRRGKYFVIHLAPKAGKPAVLAGHLRMSGRLDFFRSGEPQRKHDRLIFSLSGNEEMRFHDVRKFGKWYLTDSIEDVVGDMGPEPLSDGLTTEVFEGMLSEKRGAIKPLLLNQKFIAGLGNIYVDEALWRAKIHPLEVARDVDSKRARKLHRDIRKILTEAINAQGTDFGDKVVEAGDYVTRIYGREGLKCKRCRSIIEKIWVGQRGTHFCPFCQNHRG